MHHNQQNINAEVELMYADAVNEYYTKFIERKHLRNRSNADVVETENYFILRANSSLIACIEKETGNCYDVQIKVAKQTKENDVYIRWFTEDYGSSPRKHIWRYII